MFLITSQLTLICAHVFFFVAPINTLTYFYTCKGSLSVVKPSHPILILVKVMLFSPTNICVILGKFT